METGSKRVSGYEFMITAATAGLLATVATGVTGRLLDHLVSKKQKTRSPNLRRVPWQPSAKEMANHIAWTATAEMIQRVAEQRGWRDPGRQTPKGEQWQQAGTT